MWQVKSIAKSEASEGLWRLVFTTTTGSSSGKLGPFVGEVLQDIEMDKAQCTSRHPAGLSPLYVVSLYGTCAMSILIVRPPGVSWQTSTL